MTIRPCLCVLGLLLSGAALEAQTDVWNGGGGANTNWSDPFNWAGGSVPVNDGSENIMFTSSIFTSTVDSNYSINSLQIGGSSTVVLTNSAGATLTISNNLTYQSGNNAFVLLPILGTGTLTFSGGPGTLTLNPGGPSLNTYSGNTQVQGGGILADSAGYSFSANSILDVGGGSGGTVDVNHDEAVSALEETSGSNGSVVIASGKTLFMTGGFSTTFSGVISGAGGIEKDNVGTLDLTGNNSYTGPTVVGPGAAIDIGGGGSTGSIASNSVSGAGSLAFDLTVPYTYAGTLSGSLNVVQQATGTTTLTGTNDYSGPTTVNHGTLLAGSTSAFGGATGLSDVTVNPAGTLNLGTFSNTIGTLAGTGSVVLGSGATLTTGTVSGNTVFGGVISGPGSLNFGGYILSLSGNNTYTGTTTVSGGVLLLDNASGHALSGPGAVSLLNGSALQVGNSDTAGSLASSIAITTSSGGGVVFARTDNINFANAIGGTGGVGQFGTGMVTLTSSNTYSGTTDVFRGTLQAGTTNAFGGGLSDVTMPNTGTLDLNGFNNTVDSISGVAGTAITLGSATLTVGGAVTTTYAGVISGTGSLAFTGSGTLNLTGNNGYTGTTTIGSNATLSVGDGLTTGPRLSSALVADAGTLAFDPTAGDFIPFAGNITGAGAVTIIGAASGLTQLSGTNNYTGNTYVNSGDLTDGNNNSFSPNSSILLAANGSLQVNYNETVGSLQNGGGAGPVTITGGTTLTSNGLAYAGDFTGAISGAGSFAISSGGVQGLGGNNTYMGGTQVFGELFVSSNTAVGTGTLTFFGGSEFSPDANVVLGNTIVLNGSGGIDNDDGLPNWAMTLNGAISGTNGFTWCTPGVLTLTAANTFMGGIDMREGTLLLGSDTAAGSGGIILDTGTVLAAYGGPGVFRSVPNNIDLTGSSAQLGNNDDNNLTINGQISGNAALTYAGGPSGTLTLTADNTPMQGGFTIASGTAIAANNSALGYSGDSVYLTGGAGLSVASGITINNPLVFSGSANVLSGSGTIATNVVADGGVVVSPGYPLGNLTFSNGLTFANGGTVTFHLYDATGAAGTGYSLFTATGGLNFTASMGTLNFNIVTIDSSGNAAPAINFNPASSYAWMFASSSTAIGGFNPNQFNLVASNFLNSTGMGTFSLNEIGNNLILDFTPVPEPSTWALLGMGVLALIPVIVRRWQRA